MHFGFSYIGLIFLVMLMLPNIMWTKNQPKDYEKYVVNENKVLLAFERVGEVLVSGIALIFSDFNIKPWSNWSWWLVMAFALMILYEIFWIRYFRSEKTMKDFYRTFTAVSLAYRLRAQRCRYWLFASWPFTGRTFFLVLLLSYWESGISAFI